MTSFYEALQAQEPEPFQPAQEPTKYKRPTKTSSKPSSSSMTSVSLPRTRASPYPPESKVNGITNTLRIKASKNTEKEKRRRKKAISVNENEGEEAYEETSPDAPYINQGFERRNKGIKQVQSWKLNVRLSISIVCKINITNFFILDII
jgi:hypothetical protein